MKTKSFSLFKYNRFEFGNQVVSQFVVFECKWLFSIIFFYFHPCGRSQDRFHTHAFNALSIKVFGTYKEYVLLRERRGDYELHHRTEVFKYFPRDRYHKIGHSNGCLTMLLAGPWKPTWKEFIEETGEVKTYHWGRE